ncbi:hypothetical protein JG688_00011899 [Phytophthora aleatoria]|uniref:Uncharacterized protein n=1 Tax=Phytophthora aleatoria TaxID=2496075 RepID=A0A8J5J3Q2_9STRA|nr:hypothetical protein JG688_00011899 [Phytophthora aleatoria]
MLSETKTISCNRPQKTIHFLFFDGETAVNYQLTLVPFRKTLYRLANKLIPRRDCVIAYEIRMYNATRFLDIGRLTAYIKKNVRVDFELEGLDMCTPNSPASAVWKRTFKLAGCPELRGTVRILSFGTGITLKWEDDCSA